MRACPFCHCTNSFMMFDTSYYYVVCLGCGAHSPRADWQKDAEDYWDGTREPDKVVIPNEYMG